MARSKKTLTVPALHVIAQAVEPLRVAAVAQAAEQATAFLAGLKAKIVAQPLVNTLAPYPAHVNKYRVSQAEWAAYSNAHDFRTLVNSLTDPVESDDDTYSCYDPETAAVVWNDESAARYMQKVVDKAEHNYKVYALKLIDKVEGGNAKAATASLSGDDYLWAQSTLTVTLTDGTVQRWFTKMIWNVSVLGNVFNQFPTRLLNK